MLLRLQAWFLRPASILKLLFSGVLLFLLIEVEPLFIYVSFLVLFLSPVLARIPRIISNLLLIGLTFYLGLYFQLELHPESAISFFMILTAFKFTQVIEQRDFYFLLHCLFIVIGGGALFNHDLYYICFSIPALTFLFFMFQLKDFKSSEGINKENILNIVKIILIASPLIAALFVFFPRYRYFFPSLGSNKTGKIGYSQTLNNNSISSLRLNGLPALRVYTKEKVNQSDLYWRGRVFVKTDGYNWKVEKKQADGNVRTESNTVNFEATYQPLQNFFGDIIVKDWPVSVEGKGFLAKLNKGNQTYSTYFKNNKKQYSGKSAGESFSLVPDERYSKFPLISNEYRKYLPVSSKGASFQEVIRTLRQWLQNNNFRYSLSPGKMNTLPEFLSNKKGYCTHYSSLLALYLRLNGFPSRIVSGFQGGEFNAIGSYYLIRSNDAHSWVEAYYDNKWKRVDPTGWIAPERILAGGQRFLAPYPFADGLKGFFGLDLSKTSFLNSYYDFQKTIDYLNSRVNLFLNNFNLEAQKLLAKSLNLNLKLFFSLVLILPTLIVFIFFLVLNIKRNRFTDVEVFHRKFDKKLKELGLNWSPASGTKRLLEDVKNHPKESVIKEILLEYINLQYKKKSLKTGFQRITKLLKSI